MKRSTVLSDASFSINKGSPFAGWAVWVRIDGVSIPIKRSGYFTNVTCQNSNEAEMYAALNGLYLAKYHGATESLLRTDSMTVELLVRCQVKSELLVDRWNEGLTRAGLQDYPVRATHIKGHNGVRCPASYVNDWCDKEAKAMRLKSLRESHVRGTAQYRRSSHTIRQQDDGGLAT